MKAIFLIALLVVGCSQVAPPTPVAASRPTPGGGGGTDFGNGADTDTEVLHWFPGGQSVSICSQEKYRESVLSQFAVWNEYARDRVLKSDEVVIRPVWLGDCATHAAQIQFLFGSESTPDSELARARYRAPRAYAHYFSREGAAYGLVWVEETDLDTMQALTRHEIGHIYGIPHVPDTVMAENYADTVDGLSAADKTRIDLGRELVPHYLKAKEVTFTVYTEEPVNREAMAKFLARSPRGESVTVKIARDQWSAPQPWQVSGLVAVVGAILPVGQQTSLTFSDADGDAVWTSEDEQLLAEFDSGLETFRRFTNGKVESMPNSAAYFRGRFTSERGALAEVSLDASTGTTGKLTPNRVQMAEFIGALPWAIQFKDATVAERN